MNLTKVLYFTTSTVIDWVDIFTRPSYRHMKALQQDEQESRHDWLLDRFWFAGANDKRIKNFRFWQEGNYVEEIYTMDFLLQKLNYIHQNPVRAEIVARPEDYLYSSAMDYAGEKGLLKVELIK